MRPAAPYIERQTELSGNTVLLCRFLRKKGFRIGPTEEKDALLAISVLPIQKEETFKGALRAILAKSQYHRLNFDTYYQEFWEEYKKAVDSKTKEVPEELPKKNEVQQKKAQFEALKNWLNLSPSPEEKEVASYSTLEVLTQQDFSNLSEDEMRVIMQVLQQLARKLMRQKSRLRRVSKKRKHLDLKRTIKFNLRKGGTIQKLVYSEKKEKKLELVLLCDVSRSMELYSRFFIHLMYAFQNAHDKLETFVFSTALHHVSQLLDNYEFNEAFERISTRVPHWSGGTTIGNCLNNFVKDHGHRMLHKKTIVFILSDGWDTGDPELMKSAMKTIYKSVKKVIWLNPLAGHSDFSPEVLGMKTALPYIDTLAPAHNLRSLKEVLGQLKKRRKMSNTYNL